MNYYISQLLYRVIYTVIAVPTLTIKTKDAVTSFKYKEKELQVGCYGKTVRFTATLFYHSKSNHSQIHILFLSNRFM